MDVKLIVSVASSIAVGALAYFFLRPKPSKSPVLERLKTINVVAHRGCRLPAEAIREDTESPEVASIYCDKRFGLWTFPPENTLAAFNFAADQGAQGIELDVRLTKDGQVVVFHDAGLARMIHGDGFVRDMTYEELSKLSYRRPVPSRQVSDIDPYANERVPLLSDVLELILQRDLILFLEIKDGHGANLPKKVAQVLLANEAAAKQVVVIAFNPWVLRSFKANCNTVPVFHLSSIGMLRVRKWWGSGKEPIIGFPRRFLRSVPEKIVDLFDLLYFRLCVWVLPILFGACGAGINSQNITPSITDVTKRFGLFLNIWVVNEFQDLQKYKEHSHIIVTTDYLFPKIVEKLTNSLTR